VSKVDLDILDSFDEPFLMSSLKESVKKLLGESQTIGTDEVVNEQPKKKKSSNKNVLRKATDDEF
jgi:hypothetical protein